MSEFRILRISYVLGFCLLLLSSLAISAEQENLGEVELWQVESDGVIVHPAAVVGPSSLKPSVPAVVRLFQTKKIISRQQVNEGFLRKVYEDAKNTFGEGPFFGVVTYYAIREAPANQWFLIRVDEENNRGRFGICICDCVFENVLAENTVFEPSEDAQILAIIDRVEKLEAKKSGPEQGGRRGLDNENEAE